MRVRPWLLFLTCIPLGILLVWLVLATWIIAAPLTIMPIGQVGYLAKDRDIRACKSFPIVVFGDSRVEAAIDQSLIAKKALNVAMGLGNPAIDYQRLKLRLACPDKPELVILSYGLPELTRISDFAFWQTAVGSHLLPFRYRSELIGTISATHDTNVFQPLHGEDQPLYASIPPALKNVLYEIYFPPFYSSSVFASLRGGLIIRAQDNARVLGVQEAAAEGGHYHDGAGFGGPARDAELRVAAPNPVIDHYLRKMLDLLRSDNIPTLLAIMPVNAATSNSIPEPVRRSLLDYLHKLTLEYPNARLSDRDLPVWPDRFFSDVDLHLNLLGSRIATRILNGCLRSWPHPVGPEAIGACSFAKPEP